MRLHRLFRRAILLLGVAAMAAGCDASQTNAGVASPAYSAARYSKPTVRYRGRSWIAPGVIGRTLIYAGGDESSYVFTTGGKVVGNIAETSFGTCSDKEGDVFFTQVNGIVEYAHGGTTPIGTYGAPGTVYSCSVDPTTGDLAAVVLCLSGCGDEVAIWRTPGDPLETYQDTALPSLLYCGYDRQGNLYVDGYNGTTFGLAELPAGGTALANITVSKNIQFAAQVQWDGHYVAIETKDNPAIYQVQVSGSTGQVVGTTTLTGVGMRATQSWIFDGRIAVPTGPVRKRAIEILFWKYPSGGTATKSFTGFIGKGHAMIDGVTVSVPPHKKSDRYNSTGI